MSPILEYLKDVSISHGDYIVSDDTNKSILVSRDRNKSISKCDGFTIVASDDDITLYSWWDSSHHETEFNLQDPDVFFLIVDYLEDMLFQKKSDVIDLLFDYNISLVKIFNIWSSSYG